MKKLTKLLSVFVIAGAVGTGVVGAGCNSHTHTYNYKDNGNGTHTASCVDGDDEITDQLHVDSDSDNKCDQCGAAITSQGTTPVVEDKVTKVEISGGNEVAVKGTLTLTATVTVTGNAAKTVTWSSSDELKATVSNGVVTGVAEGEVTITATSTVDTTKKAELKITVKPEGTVITPPEQLDYTTVYNNDYRTATVTTGEANTYPTAGGVYQATNADEITEANMVQITDDTLEIIDTNSDSKKGTTYGYVRLNENQELKHVKIDLTFKVGATGGNWRILTIYDAEGKPIVYGHSNSNKNFGLSLDASTVLNTGATYAKDQDITLDLTLDLVNGKISGTVTVGTTTIDYTGDNAISINATSFSGIGFMTANSANDRKITVSNFVVKAADANLADLQSALGARLDAAYATYELTGDDAAYSANGSLITAAYNTGKTAINASDATLSSVSAAYAKAINDMADVLSDADMDQDTAPSYKESALQVLNAYIAGKNISIAPVTIGGVVYGTDINETIGDDNWAAFTGYQKKSDVDAWVTTVKALFDDIKNDETVLAEIKAAAIEDIQGYESDAIEALKTDKAAFYERIQLLIRDADTTAEPAVAEGTVITAINALTAATAGNVETILANAKTSIDAILQSATETPEQTKGRLVGEQNDGTDFGELGVYAVEAKAKLVNDAGIWSNKIDEAVSAGKTAVWAIESAADITTAYEQATAAIDFVVAKYTAHQSIVSYANEKSGSLHEDALADAAKVSIQAVYGDTSGYITALAAAADDAAITEAVNGAKDAIDEIIKNLNNTELTVAINGVDGVTSATVKYGTALKASDIDVSGLVNKMVKAWHVNSLTGDVYDFSTIIYDNSVTLYAELVDATLITGTVNWKYATDGATLPEALKAIEGASITDNSSKASIEIKYDVLLVKISGSNVGNYIKITLKSTGNGNWSTIGVKDSDGNYMEIVEAATGSIKKHTDKNLYAVQNETTSTLTFKTVKAGVYTIFTEDTSDADNGGLGKITRAARVTEIEVVDKHYEENDVTVTWGNVTKTYHHDTEIIAPVPTDEELNGEAFDGWYLGDDKWQDGTKLAAGTYVYTLHTRAAAPVTDVNITSANTVGLGKTLNLTAALVGDGDLSLLGWSVVSGNATIADGVLSLTADAKVGDKITIKVVYDNSETIVDTMEITVVSTAVSGSLDVGTTISSNTETNVDTNGVITIKANTNLTTKALGAAGSSNNPVVVYGGTTYEDLLVAGGSNKTVTIKSTKAATLTLVLSSAADSNARNSIADTITIKNGDTTVETISITASEWVKANGNSLDVHTVSLELEADDTITISFANGRLVILSLDYSYMP